MTIQHESTANPIALSGLCAETAAQLVDMATDAIFITADRTGRITWMSPGAKRVLGTNEEALYLPTALISNTGGQYEWTVAQEDGHSTTLRLDITPLIDEPGGYAGFGSVGVDIRADQQHREWAQAAVAREAEASRRVARFERMKREFAETASHELRTPLTSISGYLEMLEDETGSWSTEAVTMVAAMRRNCQRLESLVDDLSTLCSIDLGDPARSLEIDLITTLRAVARTARPLLTRTRTHLILEVPSKPVMVKGDSSQLERVVMHLLSNASKFTDPGGTVHCRLENVGERARIEVSDDGIGIPTGEEDFVFDRFYRGSNALSRESQGAGLGLTIVRGIVAGHGGTIAARSGSEGGTTITVSLPSIDT